jgi:hypothetical protein
MLNDAYKIIESLRAELFKSRAKTQTELCEKEKAESKCLNAKLKLDQEQATLLEVQEAMNAMLKDQRRNLEQAFETAAKGIQMQTCMKELSAGLLSRSPGKTATEKPKAQRTPRHQTGLSRTPSPALNSTPPRRTS